MSEKFINIRIPRDLYDEIERRINESQGEFRDVNEYIEFVLNEIVKEEEHEKAYTPEEEEEIKRRLKKLGYL